MHYIKKYNKYYKITKHQKIKVSKKEFCKYIKNKLRRSVYPTQYRVFSFLKIHKKFYKKNSFCGNSSGKYVPCDYLLKNIVLKLWKNNIQTYGWDQGNSINHKSKGFISFKSNDNNKKKIFDLFGKENIYQSFDLNKKKIKKNKILFQNYSNFMSISFLHTKIPWIHQKLNINIPNIGEAYPGNLIEFKDKDNGKRIYFTSKKYKKLMK